MNKIPILNNRLVEHHSKTGDMPKSVIIKAYRFRPKLFI